MSPIKGLTDSVQAAFPRIGKLRKGGPAVRDADGKTKRPGEDLDHWRFTSDQPEVVAAFEDAYGEAPVFVNAYLPYADVDRAFQTWKEKWAAGGLVHRCDGETMTIWQDDKGKYQRSPRPCDGGCDEVGRLALLIPELVLAGYVGYVTAETHGLNDLLSIQASLMAAAESRVGNPLGLRGIQWRLSRRKEKVSTPMPNGKRGRRDKWLVKLEPAADWMQLQIRQAHAETMALPAPSGAPERVIDVDTGEIIETKDDDYQDEEAVGEAAPVAQPTPEPTPTAQKPQATTPKRPMTPVRDEREGPTDEEQGLPPEPTPNPTPAAPERPTQGMLTRFGQLWQDAKDLGLDPTDLVIDVNKDTRERVIRNGKALAERIELAKMGISGPDKF